MTTTRLHTIARLSDFNGGSQFRMYEYQFVNSMAFDLYYGPARVSRKRMIARLNKNQN